MKFWSKIKFESIDKNSILNLIKLYLISEKKQSGLYGKLLVSFSEHIMKNVIKHAVI